MTLGWCEIPQAPSQRPQNSGDKHRARAVAACFGRLLCITRLGLLHTYSFLLVILLSNHGHCRRRRVQVSVSGSVIIIIVCLKSHSYSLTVFSPSGKLVQIEHALAAVSQGTTSLGIKGIHPLTSLL